MTEHEQKKNPFKLPPLKRPSIPFKKYLMELKDHPERSDTAQGLILRALLAMGVEKPEDEQDLERRQYLQMLSNQGYLSLNAFKRVAGSQRFQMQIVFNLKSGSQNGTQLYQLSSVEGPPGSGKDLFKDGVIESVVKFGSVWAIKGCPDHENPLNILKMDEITTEQLSQFAEMTGLGDELYEMLKTASKPCQCCHKMVMGDLDEATPEPDLEKIEVEELRLSNYSGGIQEWKPGQSCSLEKALRKANRGFIALNDAWLQIELEPGKADERLILLDAPQYRRLTGIAADGCVDPPADSPLDVFIMATTNQKAFEKFLNTLPDKDAFTGRCIQLKLPYNTVRVEEIRAYKEAMQKYHEVAEYDPLALKMIATVAILSRFKVPKPGDLFAHPLDKMRILQGEKIRVRPLDGSQNWNTIWSTTSSSGYSSYNDPYAYSKPSTSTSSSDNSPLNKNTDLTVSALWEASGAEEGMSGLDMRFMLSLISSINALSLAKTEQMKKSGDGKQRKHCVSTLEALAHLRSAIIEKLNTSNLTADQKTIYERCLKWLGGKPAPGASAFGGPNPDLIECEYLRLLKYQFIHVFAPDYEQRGQQAYDDYKLFARASVDNQRTVKHPKLGNVPVNTRILDEIDCYRLGKPKGSPLSAEEKEFRGAPLQSLILNAQERFYQQEGLPADAVFEETWRTVPQLAEAISAMLDEGIGETIGKLLTTEVRSNLTEDEQAQLASAEERLKALGYCKGCMASVLQYGKSTKVWSFKLK